MKTFRTDEAAVELLDYYKAREMDEIKQIYDILAKPLEKEILRRTK